VVEESPIKYKGKEMFLSSLKKLFGFGPAPVAPAPVAEVAPAPVAEAPVVIPVAGLMLTVEGAGEVAVAPKKKAAAKKPAVEKKPRAKKAPKAE
jgi:hypothetical protein